MTARLVARLVHFRNSGGARPADCAKNRTLDTSRRCNSAPKIYWLYVQDRFGVARLARDENSALSADR